jgi:hypothetical protein
MVKWLRWLELHEFWKKQEIQGELILCDVLFGKKFRSTHDLFSFKKNIG